MKLTDEQVVRGIELAKTQLTDTPEHPPIQPIPESIEVETTEHKGTTETIGQRDTEKMHFDSQLERKWFLEHQREAFSGGLNRRHRVRGALGTHKRGNTHE